MKRFLIIVNVFLFLLVGIGGIWAGLDTVFSKNEYVLLFSDKARHLIIAFLLMFSISNVFPQNKELCLILLAVGSLVFELIQPIATAQIRQFDIIDILFNVVGLLFAYSIFLFKIKIIDRDK